MLHRSGMSIERLKFTFDFLDTMLLQNSSDTINYQHLHAGSVGAPRRGQLHGYPVRVHRRALHRRVLHHDAACLLEPLPSLRFAIGVIGLRGLALFVRWVTERLSCRAMALTNGMQLARMRFHESQLTCIPACVPATDLIAKRIVSRYDTCA